MFEHCTGVRTIRIDSGDQLGLKLKQCLLKKFQNKLISDKGIYTLRDARGSARHLKF